MRRAAVFVGLYIAFAVICYLIIAHASGSSDVGIAFGLIPAGFMLPAVLVSAAAHVYAQANSIPPMELEEKKRNVVVFVVEFVFSIFPYWYACISWWSGRRVLGLVLFLAFLLPMSAALRRLFVARVATEQELSSQARAGNS